tara:strand:- start:7768 stop:8205 length:438 start_codon:yes stop_codon:yes gene_type:complete
MQGVLRIFIGFSVIAGLLLFIYVINTPKEVKTSFAKKFPMVTDVYWERESIDEWEAEFSIQNIEYSANFLDDGTWVETEHKIAFHEITLVAKNALTKEFSNYKVELVELLETLNISAYEIQISKDSKSIEVLISLEGLLLSNLKE